MGKKKEAAGTDAPAEIPVIDMEDLDVFTVEDVSDVGNGEPLFANFVYEDWALLSARMEFHFLVHSFKKDLNDPDRPSFTEQHYLYYYHKYHKKNFKLNMFSVEKLDEFVSLIQDTIVINEAKFFEAVKPEDESTFSFVKLAEEHRRDRSRRYDAGDETALIKFKKPQPAATAENGGDARGGRDSKGK